MTTEELQIIKEFNRNVTWLKTQSIKKAPQYTAQQLTKLTGWSYDELRRKRDRKEIVFTKVKSGGYRYEHDINLSSPILPTFPA